MNSLLKTCWCPMINDELSHVIAHSIRPDNVYVEESQGELKRAALVNAKRWAPGQTITIAFLNGEIKQQEMVKQYASDWLNYANLSFQWDVDLADSMVRVAFKEGGGSFSYIGTDCLGVKKSDLTIQYGWLDPGVIRHEMGHMLGLLHSHESRNFPYHFNEDVVIKALSGPPNNWDVNMIKWNVLDKESDPDTETIWNPNQVMNYYMPKEWIKEGVAIEPGQEIGDSEKELVGLIYPKGISEKVITPGVAISGSLPDHFSLVTTTVGLYQMRFTPRDMVIMINNHQAASLVPLGVGKQTFDLRGTGSYNFVIRKW